MDHDFTKHEHAAVLAKAGEYLLARGYSFVTVTPETHRRALLNRSGPGMSLRDIFGWNRAFARDALPCALFEMLASAGVLVSTGDLFVSRVRYSTLGRRIYAHSAYPTVASDSVFFGPDTYRFAALIDRELAKGPMYERPRIVDIGAGSGAGGIFAADRFAQCELVLADISDAALQYSAANARAAGVATWQCINSDVFAAIQADADIIVSNPPYLSDPAARLYRHGGDALGAELSLRILRESIERLRPGGVLILYTGSAIVDGRDGFREAAVERVSRAALDWSYSEIDPDVFGEELERDAYCSADRIAAVSLVVRRATH